jgi:translation initiation factor 2 subunit 1
LLLKRTGFPQEEELVLCTVTSVQFHSVFVTLDEYNRTGLIHISEIAPGRIRNIRDYVVEGKKVVCMILRIDKEKGHIDLSLRRVNEKQKRAKLNQIKEEQLAENIIVHLAKKLNKNPEEFYIKITPKIFEKYTDLFTAFEDASQGKIDLKDFMDEKIAKEITEIVIQRIKPKAVELSGDIKIISTAPDGVEVVKSILKTAEEAKEKPAIKYKGAGTYLITVTADDYKAAEKILNEIAEKAEKEAKKQKASFEFKKIEKD